MPTASLAATMCWPVTRSMDAAATICWSEEPATTISMAGAATTCCARSEEHTSELQSLMRISYAVFCLKKKNKQTERNIAALNMKPAHEETVSTYENFTFKTTTH